MTDHLNADWKSYALLASSCTNNSCPTVYRDNDSIVVQGYVDNLPTPEGEEAVRIPLSTFVDAARSVLHLDSRP